MIESQNRISNDLKFLLFSIACLLIIGLIFIYSSSSVFALETLKCAHYFLKKQLMGLAIGSVAMIIFSKIPLELVKKLTPYFFWFTLFLTSLTLIPFLAVKIHGSSRWIRLGFAFQPSELLKIAFILYIAYLLEKTTKQNFSFVKSYLPFILIISIVSLILLKQPDFGLTVTLSVTALLLLFVANLPMKHLMLSTASTLPLISILIYKYPYRLQRVLTFLNPWDDPKGTGFQIIQSLIAIGSGHFFGVGIANSKQKFFYLPMQHTDFILSIIAEETGLFGITIILLLYFMFLYFGIKIAQQLKDRFNHFVMVGFVLFTTLQALINIFVVCAMLPTKGIGLPFVSYGNSALISSFCMIGLICNIAKNDKLKLFH